MTTTEFKQIPLNQITAKDNYRKTFRDKSLKELAQSIKGNGVIEPIIVRANNDGFEIIAGERRYRASVIAGLVTMPAIVREVADADVLKLQIVENVQREGVQFMEEAYALKKLRDDCSLDVREIAAMIGKSNAYVYYMLRLCDMTDDARLIAEKNWITKAVAWEICKITDKDQQSEAANALARTNTDKLITASGAKHYIRDNFEDGTPGRMRKVRVETYGGSDYVSNWKKYLVNFDCEQFERFKTIVRGRTQTDVLAEAVDLVMRRDTESALVEALEK